MMLAESEVHRIRYEREHSGVTISTLKDDLLDHLCCIIEEKMDEGESFDHCLHMDIGDLAPKGLAAIEKESIFLLNPKLILMEKMTFLSGSIFAIMASSGFFLKALHWSLGDPMLTIGITGLLLVFVPFVLFEYAKSNETMMASERMRFLFGVGSATLTGIGFVLKLNHIVGANLAIVIGGILLSFGFIPAFFYRLYTNAVE